jgi:hypothetical protein
MWAEGRICNDCHQNEAVRKIQNGEKVPVVSFNNGKVETWKRAVPVVKGKLDCVFLNRTENGWEVVPSNEDPKVQFAAYGTPLSEAQFQKLAQNSSDLQ